MSYDLMVFDPKAAPQDRKGFLLWFHDQTVWGEGHSYNDPTVCAPDLRAWFLDIIKAYPAMNGPYASDNVDDPKVTDYSIGKLVIYAAFSWSETEGAYRSTFDLAKKHRLGFFDVSADDGQVWVPGDDGGYVCIHGKC
jgi:hypothetical protein